MHLKRYFLSAILCLALCAPAFGVQIKSIDGSTANSGGGWGSLAGTLATGTNSGNAAGTRFSLVSAGSSLDWTYRAFSALDPAPSGITSNGYLESTENKQCYLQLESTNSASASDTHYWLSFWMRGARTATSLVGSDLSANLCGAVTGGNWALTNLTLNNSTAATAPGYNVSLSGNLIGTAVPLWDCNASTKSPAMRFGEWYHVTVHFYRHTSAGYIEIFVNDRKVIQSAATDTSTTITWASQALLMLTPAWAGTTWHIAGPVESWSGVDITLNPLHAFDASRPVSKVFMPAHATVSTSLAQGLDWQWTGAGLAVSTEYANSAGSPRRRIFTCSSGTPVATTTQDIGALPFNEQGWATLVWQDVYVPGGELKLATRNAANDANVTAVRCLFSAGDSTVDFAYTDGTNIYYLIQGLPSAAVYDFFWHFHRDGRATWTLINLTGTMADVGRGVYSGALPDWTVQTLGKGQATCTYSTTALTFGGLVVGKRPSIVAVDSLSTHNYTTPTPDVRTPYNIAQALPTLEERQCLPNGYWNQRENGFPREFLVSTVGQSGLTRREWSGNALSGFEFTRGVKIVFTGGGFVNDLFSGTVTPTGDPAESIEITNRLITETVDFLTERDNAVWLTTATPHKRRQTVTAITEDVDGAGTGKCKIAATAHGVTATTQTPRILGGTGIAGIDNSPGLTVLEVAADTFTVDVNYASPTLVAPVTEPLSETQEEFRDGVNTHIRKIAKSHQYKGLVSLSDIDADADANPATYATTTTFWTDIVHPTNWNPATAYTAGSWVIAQRMALTRVKPPAPIPPRR